jgi:hypothetical protein
MDAAVLSDETKEHGHAIAAVIEEREKSLGARDERLRTCFAAYLWPVSVPLARALEGLDAEGWRTWIELQREIARRALYPTRRADVLEFAAEIIGEEGGEKR